MGYLSRARIIVFNRISKIMKTEKAELIVTL